MKNTFFSLCLLLALSASAQKGPINVEIPVFFEGDTVHGSLVASYPLGSRKLRKQAVVIFIPGSGPTDRNGNSAMMRGPNDAFLQLADSLLVRGIASYRYDKPGVGASSTSRGEEDMRFEDNARLVENIYAKLRKLGFRDIFILGHSEGSLIGMLAAQKLKVKGYISLAGAGQNTYDLLKEQLSKQLQGEMLESTLQKLDSVKQGYTVNQYNPMLHSLLRPSVQPYLHSWFHYSPQVEIAQLKCPVLILQGGRDIQVSVEDAKALKKAAPEATLSMYPDMNHVLKVVDDSQEQNMAAYSDPDFPLEPQLIRDIAAFVKDN